MTNASLIFSEEDRLSSITIYARVKIKLAPLTALQLKIKTLSLKDDVL